MSAKDHEGIPFWAIISICSTNRSKLTRDLPMRSAGFPPANAVDPPASQHGVFGQLLD